VVLLRLSVIASFPVLSDHQTDLLPLCRHCPSQKLSCFGRCRTDCFRFLDCLQNCLPSSGRYWKCFGLLSKVLPSLCCFSLGLVLCYCWVCPQVGTAWLADCLMKRVSADISVLCLAYLSFMFHCCKTFLVQVSVPWNNIKLPGGRMDRGQCAPHQRATRWQIRQPWLFLSDAAVLLFCFWLVSSGKQNRSDPSLALRTVSSWYSVVR
jgi:hypothetical protein